MNQRVEHLADKLREKITVSHDECWLWSGHCDTKGYGVVRWNGRPMKAHRVVFECLGDPIPEGLQLDHLCRVRNCVNPEHLEPVTGKENIARGKTGELNRAKTNCPQGHEYSESNTYVDKRGKRYCRTCLSDKLKVRSSDPEWQDKRRARMRRWYAERKSSNV